jgi:hypothetical protein
MARVLDIEEDHDVKRPALALSAGILLLALMPGSAMANIPGVLDQSNTSITMNANAAVPLAQTFTAGKTGLMNDVQLYMAAASGSIYDAKIEATIAGLPDDSTVLATNPLVSPSATAGWVDFSFAPPAAVISGNTYAIVFNMSDLGAPSSVSGSGDTYSGGQALVYSGTSWIAVNDVFNDFAFQTYVDPQTTKLQWDKAQVVAGTGTALTLTETIVFPDYSVPQAQDMGAKPNPAAPTPVWTVKSDALPAWFTPTGVTCAGQVAPADCTLANVAPGASLPVTPDGNPISIVLTLTGTASPALADVGTGTGKAEGCALYPEVIFDIAPAQAIQSCVAGQATVAVVAPAANPTPTPAPNATPAPTPTPRPATPPPTAAGGPGSSNGPGSSIWFLAIGLIAAIGGVLLLVNRQQRRIR